MNETRRNIAVGVTVLLALAGLAFMILLFGQAPTFFQRGYVIHIAFPQSGGVTKGGDVHLNGQPVGKITDIQLMPDPRQGVAFECRINYGVKIPKDSDIYISTRGLGGGTSVELMAKPLLPGQIDRGFYPTDGSAYLTGSYEGTSLIPKELTDQLGKMAEGFASFSRLADNLNQLIQPASAPTTTTTGTGPATTTSAPSLAGTVTRLNQAMDGFNAIVSDPQNQANIKVTLANLATASQNGAAAMEEIRKFATNANATVQQVGNATESVRKNMDDLTRRLIGDADRLGQLLTALSQTVNSINTGQGTAGKLLNDPQLYNSLVEATERLSRTMAELQITVKQWQAEGVRLKLR